MKIVKKINEGKLRNLVEQVLSELDWRTYASAAEKRQKQTDNAYAKQDWDKGYKASNSRYELQRQAQDAFNQKHAPSKKDSKYTFYQSHNFDQNGKRTGTFAAHHYNPNTGIARDIKNGQSTEKMVSPQQGNYAVPVNGTMSMPDQEIADFQTGKSKYNKNTHQWESKVHAITSRVVKQLRESADKHVTPQRLHSLVEQALNELDWKTYMNASSKIADAQRALERGEYDNPVVLKTITRALAKKFGAKKARMLMDGFNNEQIEDLLNMMHRDLDPDSDLYNRREDLENVATDAFARKHGHKRNVQKGGEGELAYNYTPSLETVDSEGNVYNMEDPSIWLPSDKSGYSPSTTFYVGDDERGTESEWDDSAETEDDAEKLKQLRNSEAAKDLAGYHSGESQYSKDTHQWESFKRRIVGELLESAYDPKESGEYDDPGKEADYQSAIECQRRFGSFGKSYNNWRPKTVFGPEAMEVWERAQQFLAHRHLGHFDGWYEYKYKS